jgi:hypothetical protein
MEYLYIPCGKSLPLEFLVNDFPKELPKVVSLEYTLLLLHHEEY